MKYAVMSHTTFITSAIPLLWPVHSSFIVVEETEFREM